MVIRLDQTRLLLVSVLLFLAHTVTAEEHCIDGEVRLLVTEQTHMTVTGFVQYCMSGEWRMVCRGIATCFEESTLARTTCRQLGYEDNGLLASAQNSSYTSPLVNINCTDGRRAGLQDCKVMSRDIICATLFPILGVKTFVKVICYKICSNGEKRLVGGSTNRAGRVEVCVDGRWESVCNNIQEDIAGAVCSQLGFPTEDALIINPTSSSVRRVFLCYPNHTCTIVHCGSSQSLAVKCLSHQEVVERDSYCLGDQEGDFRLQVNRSTPNEGRVEVCVDGGWTPVCDCGTNNTELANKLCVSPGFVSMEWNRNKLAIGIGACCFTNETHHEVTCAKNYNCNNTLEVVCQMRQTSTEELLERCPTVEPSPTMSILHHKEIVTKTLSSCSTTIKVAVNASEINSNQCSHLIQPLGTVSGVLLTLLVSALVGWMVTCAVRRRRAKCILDTSATGENSNSTQIGLTNATPMRMETRADFHDAEAHTYSVVNKKRAKKAPEDGEISRRENDFYDAEKHTYSVVDKKRAKKTPEDGKGERDDSRVDDSIMVIAETSQKEVYSKLKH